MKQLELLEKSKRAKPRILMHACDVGSDAAQFKCSRCGYVSGWLYGFKTTSEIKRGLPCPKCEAKP